MRPALLHLDCALEGQDGLARRTAEQGGWSLDWRDLGPQLRLWSRAGPLGELKRRVAWALPAGAGPVLAFSGSGDFHHITPTLLARACEAAGDPEVTVLHFDNHPDWVSFSRGVHCGSWVGRAARLPQVAKVITVGVCSDDIQRPETKNADLALVAEGLVEIYPYFSRRHGGTVTIAGQDWPVMMAMGEPGFAAFLAARITTKAVYVTIDKDVLRSDCAATNWDQGHTSLKFLLAMLERVLQDHRLIGADVVGDWSPGIYGGSLLDRVLKHGEALLDQPWKAPKAAAAAAGVAGNLALLDLFQEAAR